MAKTLSLSEVTARFPELVADVAQREKEVIVSRNGKPIAVLVSYSKFKAMMETLDVLSDAGLMRQIDESRAFYASGGKGLSFEDVFGEPLRSVGKQRRR